MSSRAIIALNVCASTKEPCDQCNSRFVAAAALYSSLFVHESIHTTVSDTSVHELNGQTPAMEGSDATVPHMWHGDCYTCT